MRVQLQVSNCSAGITNPVAQQSTIATQSVLRFTFDIYSTSDLASDSSCTVGLINSLVGALLPHTHVIIIIIIIRTPARARCMWSKSADVSHAYALVIRALSSQPA